MRRSGTSRLAPACVIAAVGFSSVATQATIELVRSSISSGGSVRATGGGFELDATIGQSTAGVLSNGAFDLSGGFWVPIKPGDCDADGTVSHFDYEVLAPCLLGPEDASPSGACRCFDVDNTHTVDLRDFALYTSAFTGP